MLNDADDQVRQMSRAWDVCAAISTKRKSIKRYVMSAKTGGSQT